MRVNDFQWFVISRLVSDKKHGTWYDLTIVVRYVSIIVMTLIWLAGYVVQWVNLNTAHIQFEYSAETLYKL